MTKFCSENDKKILERLAKAGFKMNERVKSGGFLVSVGLVFGEHWTMMDLDRFSTSDEGWLLNVQLSSFTCLVSIMYRDHIRSSRTNHLSK